jgi:hypothetical protein
MTKQIFNLGNVAKSAVTSPAGFKSFRLRTVAVMATLLAVIMMFSGCDPKDDNPDNKGKGKRLVEKTGDIINYGTYNGKAIAWQALAVDLNNNKALLIAKNCIATMPFLQEGEGDVNAATWENSTIRPWLNGTFYNAAFNAEQKARVIETAITIPANSENGVRDASQTADRVFLLNAAQCRQYFASDASMIATFNGENVSWWTLTPGNDLSGRVCTYSDGGLYMTGNYVISPNPGVRPAIWVDNSPEE